MTEEEYQALKDSKIQEYSSTPLQNNPEKTYGDVLGYSQLEALTFSAIPNLYEDAFIYGGFNREQKEDVYDVFIESGIESARKDLKTYDKPVFVYDDAVNYPEYVQAQIDYQEKSDERTELSIRERQMRENMVLRGNMPSRLVDDELMKPRVPIGYTYNHRIAKLGYNPNNVVSEEDFSFLNEMKRGMAFGTGMNLTPKDLNYAKENMYKGRYSGLLPGTFKYIDPKNPNDGVAYFEEGKEPKIWDKGGFQPIDLAEVAISEGPVIGAELFAGFKGLKRFDDYYKKNPVDPETMGAVTRFLKPVAESVFNNVFLASGAAGTRLFQRLIGKGANMHDRTPLEMVTEAGWIGILTYGGSQTMDIFMNGFPKMYRTITGKDVSAADLNAIQASVARGKASKEGEKVETLKAGTLEEVSILDIDTAIEELSKKIQVETGGGALPKYNPTLGQASKDNYMNDLEQILLTNMSDPTYKTFYDKLLAGNQDVIDKFYQGVFRNLQNDSTGSTLGATISDAFNNNPNAFVDEMESLITGFKTDIDNVKNIAAGKNTLIDQTADPKQSSLLYDRSKKNLNLIKDQIKERVNNDVVATYNTPSIQDITLGGQTYPKGTPLGEIPFSARGTRKNVRVLKDMADGNFPGSSTIGKKEAGAAYYEIFNDPIKVARLQKYTDGQITIGELNALKVDLNSYTSLLAASPKGASQGGIKTVEVLRNLQKSMEDDIYKRVRQFVGKKEALNIKNVFDAQKTAIELANSKTITTAANKDPEKLLTWMLDSNTPFAKQNTQVNNLMSFLKMGDSEIQIQGIQNELLDYIQNRFFDVADTTTTPFQKAVAYKQWLSNHKSTVEEILPKKDFGTIQNIKQFENNVLIPLKKLDETYNSLAAKYGSSDGFNIVSKILDSKGGAKAAGEFTSDIKYLQSLTDPASPNYIASGLTKPQAKKVIKLFEQQLSDVTKKYIYQRTSNNGVFDYRLLDELMNEGFASSSVVGKDLSFEGIYKPLLGDGADDFIKNLNVLRDLGFRQDPVNLGSGASKRVSASMFDPGTEYLRRFLIPPLTQFGRRATAAENLITQRNNAFVGQLLQDPALLSSYAKALKDRKAITQFIKVLYNYDIAMYTDIANTLQRYNEKEKQPQEIQTFMEGLPSGYPSSLSNRISNLGGTD